MNNIVTAHPHVARTLTPRVFIKTVAATATPERFTALPTISTTTLAGRVVTVTFGSAHQLANGDIVEFASYGQGYYNGRQEVTVTSSNAITFEVASNIPAPVDPTGSPTAFLHLLCFHAIIWGKKAAATNNTGEVRFGPSATDGTQPNAIVLGTAFSFPPLGGAAVYPLHQLYLDVSTNADGVVIQAWL
jgi:hypothetical protein